MQDKPFYARSEFWLTLIGVIPSILIGLADLFNQAVGNGSIDPNNPLYPLFLKIGAALTVAYTLGRSLKKAADAWRSSDTIVTNNVSTGDLPPSI